MPWNRYYNPAPIHGPARLFHLAVTAATVGLQRVMEVWHAAGIAVIRSRVGAIEPPVVPRITIVRDAASRMAMEEDAVDLSAEG